MPCSQVFSPFVAAFSEDGDAVQSFLDENKPSLVAGDGGRDMEGLPLRGLVQELPENVGLITLMRVRDEEDDDGDAEGEIDAAGMDDKLTLLVRKPYCTVLCSISKFLFSCCPFLVRGSFFYYSSIPSY